MPEKTSKIKSSATIKSKPAAPKNQPEIEISKEPHPYADLLHASRPKCPNPMPIALRAAQFSPYAALVGHKDIIMKDEEIAAAKIDLNHEITLDLDPDQTFPDYSASDNFDELPDSINNSNSDFSASSDDLP